MKIEVIPFKGIGELQLGVNRFEYYTKFANYQIMYLPPDAYSKGVAISHIFDLGISIHNHVSSNQIVCISLTPKSNAIFLGKELFKMSYKELKKWFKTIDGSIKEVFNDSYQKNMDYTLQRLERRKNPLRLSTYIADNRLQKTLKKR